MPLPRRVAELNRHLTNPLARLIAARIPPFVMIEHRGRRSDRAYRTPVMGWVAGDELIIALTYGPGVEWVKNLRAAGGGAIVQRGRRRKVGPPRVEHGIVGAPGIPWPIRRVLGLTGTDDYLRLPFTNRSERRPDG
jgi:deazaflavin-dependent oxidoreductase (nitroreductase family)